MILTVLLFILRMWSESRSTLVTNYSSTALTRVTAKPPRKIYLDSFRDIFSVGVSAEGASVREGQMSYTPSATRHWDSSNTAAAAAAAASLDVCRRRRQYLRLWKLKAEHGFTYFSHAVSALCHDAPKIYITSSSITDRFWHSHSAVCVCMFATLHRNFRTNTLWPRGGHGDLTGLCLFFYSSADVCCSFRFNWLCGAAKACGAAVRKRQRSTYSPFASPQQNWTGWRM